MVDNWLDLVELFEYKVSDVVAGREPAGGIRSVSALRQRLTLARMSGLPQRRFKEAERRLRSGTAAVEPASEDVIAEVSAELPADLGLAGLDATPEGEPQDDEGRALARLAVKAWRADLTDQLAALAAAKRNEPGRPMLRLLYAVLHNLEQYSQNPHFDSDLNLSRFRVIAPVPGPDDALASLTDRRVTSDLARELVGQVLDFHDRHPRLPLPDFEVLPYLRRLAMAVAEDPAAGMNLSWKGPSPREIEGALEAAKAERLAPAAKAELVARLSAQLDEARSRVREADNALHAERKALRLAAQELFSWLAERIPAHLGGRAAEVRPLAKAFMALAPQRNQADLGPTSTSLALRLAGPGSATLAGVGVAWRLAPEGWVLAVGGAEYPLDDGAHVPFERTEFRVSREGDYCLVRAHERTAPSLPDLLAAGRVAAALLDPSLDFLRLRLADGAVTWLRDRRLDRARLSPEAGRKLAAVDEETIKALARARAERLFERVGRGTQSGEVEEAFAAAARAAAEDEAFDLAPRLAARVHEAALPQVTQADQAGTVRSDGRAVLLVYRGEPLRLQVNSQGLTLRSRPDGGLTLLVHGGGSYPVDDLVLAPIEGGCLVLAREGMRVLVSFAPAL